MSRHFVLSVAFLVSLILITDAGAIVITGNEVWDGVRTTPLAAPSTSSREAWSALIGFPTRT